MVKNLESTTLSSKRIKALIDLREQLNGAGCCAFEDSRKVAKIIRSTGYGVNSKNFLISPDGKEHVRSSEGMPIKIHTHTKGNRIYTLRGYLQAVVSHAEEKYPGIFG